MSTFSRSVVVTMSLLSLVGCQTTTTTNRPFFESFQQESQPSHDTAITTSVLEAMLNNENTSTLKVHVETRQGVVLLSGYVKTIRQSDTCEVVARKTPGVMSVQNNIIVRKYYL